MSIEPRILAAISGAVTACLAEEEAAAAAVRPAPRAAAPPVNYWGLAGRSQAMQLRLLMQRRSLR